MLRKHLKDSSDVLNKALIVPATAKWQQKGFKCGATAVLQVDLNSIPWINCALAPCKRIRDSLGFWIPRRRFRISGTDFGLSVERGFRISVLRRIPDSKAHWLRFRIQQAKTSGILESGFPYMGRVVVLQPCFRSNWTRSLAWMWPDRIWSLKTRLSFSDHGTKSRSLESHCYRHRHDDPCSKGLLYK